MAVPAVHCEARKTSYRQTKEGLVVSFVIHPNDMPDALAVAPLGTRYMLALAEIGDDEQPSPPAGNPQPQHQERAIVSAERTGKSTLPSKPAGDPARERRPWETLPPANQAGIMCGDKAFHAFIRELGWSCADHIDAANWLKRRLDIDSRKELAGQPEAIAKLHEIHAEFMQWAGRVPVERR